VKQKVYIELLNRLEAAHKAGYHHEACWLVNEIFEDRTSSIIAHSGDATGCGRRISEKLRIILKRFDETVDNLVARKPVKDKTTGKKLKKPKWPKLRIFERELFSNIRNWLSYRARMPDLFASPLSDIKFAEKCASHMSERGLILSRELCAAARETGFHEMRIWPPEKIHDDEDRWY
jgi:hypothetical protein